MKLLSIAIPCYNSAAYMRHCIDTLLTGGEEVDVSGKDFLVYAVPVAVGLIHLSCKHLHEVIVLYMSLLWDMGGLL